MLMPEVAVMTTRVLFATDRRPAAAAEPLRRLLDLERVNMPILHAFRDVFSDDWRRRKH